MLIIYILIIIIIINILINWNIKEHFDDVMLKNNIKYSLLIQDIENNYSVILEGIQTKLKLLGYEDAYNDIKKISRGKNISHDIMKEYINSLNINEDDKKELINLTPNNYLGIYN
jgi:adenylosuccinate lyase